MLKAEGRWVAAAGLPDDRGSLSDSQLFAGRDVEVFAQSDLGAGRGDDSVGDVISVYDEEVQPNPASLPAAWAELSRGVYRLNDGLLLIIDVDQLLTW